MPRRFPSSYVFHYIQSRNPWNQHTAWDISSHHKKYESPTSSPQRDSSIAIQNVHNAHGRVNVDESRELVEECLQLFCSFITNNDVRLVTTKYAEYFRVNGWISDYQFSHQNTHFRCFFYYKNCFVCGLVVWTDRFACWGVVRFG